MPGNTFSFAVLVCRQIQFFRVFECGAKFSDDFGFAFRNCVDRFEAVFDINAQLRPFKGLVFFWNAVADCGKRLRTYLHSS